MMRIYPLHPSSLSERIAVAFAKTSRSPDSFGFMLDAVNDAAAESFHQKWVLEYGHNSVAEHAVGHFAIEGISRLAADYIERTRLASFTESSSRYQRIPKYGWHTPVELEHLPAKTTERYDSVMMQLWNIYTELLDTGHSLDVARGVLPAATLTNIGLTINARALAHLLRKLFASSLYELQHIAGQLQQAGLQCFPTLLRHCGPTEGQKFAHERPYYRPGYAGMDNDWISAYDGSLYGQSQVIGGAESDVANALRWGCYAEDDEYDDVVVIREVCERLDEHDQLPRDFELASISKFLTVDYGGLRELRRHRMLTLLERPLTARDGFYTPSELGIPDAGAPADLHTEDAASAAGYLFNKLGDRDGMPGLEQYAVLHASCQEVLIQVSARQLRNIARLRTTKKAHPSVRMAVAQLLKESASDWPNIYQHGILPVVGNGVEIAKSGEKIPQYPEPGWGLVSRLKLPNFAMPQRNPFSEQK